MTRGASSSSKGSSYQVTSPQYRQGVQGYQYPVAYSTRPPSKYEMSEFTATNHYVTNGNGKNGRVVPVNNGAYNGKHLQNQPSTYPVEDEEDEFEDRGHWGSKAEFILSCIGFSVGIGNVWRFPYLAYKNGGAAFLFPYFILLIFVGKPLYYLETAIGQYSRCSPLQVWRCAPIAKGVGFGMVVLSLIVSIYYNVIMAYSIFYVGASFYGVTGDLPWTYCGDWWGANENCTLIESVKNVTETFENGTEIETTVSVFATDLPRCYPQEGITENCTYLESPATQFWERYVLNITETMPEPGDLGGFNFGLPLCLMFSWLVVFLCLMKGVKSSGKVVYFTATFPYVILIALLVRGVTLPGAKVGLEYLFIPDWSKLGEFQVWRNAAEQMFFSLGISWGGLMMFGSYNKFHNKINIDAAVVSSLDFLTSIIASCVVFSILGFLSTKLEVPIETVAEKGQGLAFVVYPTALAYLPGAWIWAVLFFIMLFFLGLDSEFALLETALTAIYDGYPKLRNHKVKITALACSICYLLGLPCTSRAGAYILDLMDTYGAGFAVLWIAFGECAGFMWIYGVRNFCKDIKLMLGAEPGWFWKITWAIISPLFLLVILIASLWTWENPKYNGNIEYPEWAHGVGWMLVGLSAIQVPLWAILNTLYYLAKGKVQQVIKPERRWGPGDKEVRQQILEEMTHGQIPRVGAYAYENNGMAYEAYHM